MNLNDQFYHWFYYQVHSKFNKEVLDLKRISKMKRKSQNTKKTGYPKTDPNLENVEQNMINISKNEQQEWSLLKKRYKKKYDIFQGRSDTKKVGMTCI